MKLILCTHSGFGAWFLRLVMWSRWSHAAILDGGTVTDTTFWQGGVKQTQADEFFKHYTTYELRDIAVDEPAARAWLLQQVGKGYDVSALLSWVFRRDWQEDDRWFCSELAEAVITKFGTPRFRESVSRVTPRHQEMLA